MLHYPQCNTNNWQLVCRFRCYASSGRCGLRQRLNKYYFHLWFWLSTILKQKCNNITHWLCRIPFHNDALVLSCVYKSSVPIFLYSGALLLLPSELRLTLSRAVACLVQLELRWQTETERCQQAQIYTCIGRACIGGQYALSQNLILTSQKRAEAYCDVTCPEKSLVTKLVILSELEKTQTCHTACVVRYAQKKRCLDYFIIITFPVKSPASVHWCHSDQPFNCETLNVLPPIYIIVKRSITTFDGSLSKNVCTSAKDVSCVQMLF